MTTATPAAPGRERPSRINATARAFALGLPVAAAVLGVVHYAPLPQDNVVLRYLKHPVEAVQVVMFCVAVATLLLKYWQNAAERRALASKILPAWEGPAVPVSEASRLLAAVERLPASVQNTYLGRRVTNVLDFIIQRRSAGELDDQLRTLSDNDALQMEQSYALTRFITWAIPILGFLGTVLGITGAISGITPEKLNNSLNTVTDGLALSFDATALALGLTMVVMFLTYLVEKGEQGILENVDQFIDRELAHRFERGSIDSTPFIDATRRNTDVLLDALDRLVQRQAEVWGQSMLALERQAAQSQMAQHAQMTAALATALEQTLVTYTERLEALEANAAEQNARLAEQLKTLADAVTQAGREQQDALLQVSESVLAQAKVLGGLQEGEKQLLQLERVLHENLSALAGVGAFEQAVHSLTAAIHLFTARHGLEGPRNTTRKAA